MRRLFVLTLIALAFALLGAACQPQANEPTPPSFEISPELIVLPDDGVEQVVALIEDAETSLRLKIYLLTNDEIISALAAATNRGVDVRVLIEQYPVGGGESNQKSADKLKEAGVTVRWAPAIYQLTHEKSLLIDGERALVATFNYTDSSFRNNREYGLLTADPALVGEIAAIFDADWAGKSYGSVRNPTLVVSPLNSRQQIESFIDRAQTSLWLEENTLLDDGITDRLVAAARRGVTVRFLGPLRTGETDLAADNYLRLQAAGAQVGRLANPYVHAKVLLADGERAMVGSVNLTRASMDLNRELGLVTEDAAVIAQIQRVFEGDWQRSRQVNPAPTGAIGWQEAGDYTGAEVTVEGEIVRTHDTGKVTFLNFTPKYQGTLSLVIFAADYGDYPAPPVDYFLNKRVQAKGKVEEYQGAPEIIIESPDQIQILPVASAQPTATSAQADASAIPLSPLAAAGATPSSTPVAALPVIGWQDAGDFISQQVSIEGKVVRTHDTGNVTFLNFTNDWRGTFSVVVFANDYDKFPQPPSTYYLDQTIRVTGRVKEYQGAPEIVVEAPDAIQIIQPDQSGNGGLTVATSEAPVDATVAAPAAKPALPPAGVVPWEQAENYIGQTITVSGRILRTYDAGSITFLNFSSERDQFVVVVFADDYANFPSPPAELYRNKSVWVTGEVTEYQGGPQIVVHSPDEIEVFP